MKLRIVIDKEKEEEILIYAHEKTPLIESIEQLVEDSSPRLTGYGQNGAVLLSPDEIYCFISEGGKTYAITENERLVIKSRLYIIEGTLDNSFVRLNQSCIASINKIKRFEAGFSGSLTAVFKNGYRDYISRRQVKIVKERFGI
mgnify:CR=1 FL=1